MTSKKVVDNIDTGLWAYLPHGYIASAFVSIGDYDEGEFILNHFKEGMPAHAGERFHTIAELERAMRRYEPDLRKWHYSDL